MAWNIVEAAVAILAGVAAGSIALVGFGADSLIEVTSGGILVWRLRKAGPETSLEEQGDRERKALLVVGGTFFLLAAYVGYEALSELLGRTKAGASTVGLALSVASLVVMPILATAKLRVAWAMGSRALRADAMETWVCAYLSAALLIGLALSAALGWWWADAVAGLGMLPVMLWQGWETLEDARE
ncbi:MAG: cation transporter [Actinobacteria bacterium]|nr:cation transporter [Actinomycetota bacterium]